MKNLGRIIVLLMSLMIVGSSLTACGKSKKNQTKPNPTTIPEPTQSDSGTKKVSLRVWGPQEEQDAYEGYGGSLLAYMCDRFNKAHPEWDITFNYTAVAENDCKKELLNDADGGADVFMFPSDQTAYLVENRILTPITYQVENVITENGGKDAVSITAATFNDYLYGVPFTPNSWFMYYDKSKFDQNDVKSLDTMMAKKLGDDTYNFAIDIDNGWYSASFFFAGGCSLFGADGQDAEECTFDSENGVAVGDYLSKLVTNPRFLEETDNGENAIAAFSQGKLGAWCSGTWNAEKVEEALGENYAACKLPIITLNGQECQMKSFADYKYIGVNQNTDPDAMEVAQALAVYLGSEECQKDRFLARSIAPTIISLTLDTQVMENIAVAALSEQAGYTQFQSTISQMDNFWDPAKEFGEGLCKKEITSKNMQRQLNSFVDKVLSVVE